VEAASKVLKSEVEDGVVVGLGDGPGVSLVDPADAASVWVDGPLMGEVVLSVRGEVGQERGLAGCPGVGGSRAAEGGQAVIGRGVDRECRQEQVVV
jgi:hypothetical protein